MESEVRIETVPNVDAIVDDDSATAVEDADEPIPDGFFDELDTEEFLEGFVKEQAAEPEEIINETVAAEVNNVAIDDNKNEESEHGTSIIASSGRSSRHSQDARSSSPIIADCPTDIDMLQRGIRQRKPLLRRRIDVITNSAAESKSDNSRRLSLRSKRVRSPSPATNRQHQSQRDRSRSPSRSSVESLPPARNRNDLSSRSSLSRQSSRQSHSPHNRLQIDSHDDQQSHEYYLTQSSFRQPSESLMAAANAIIPPLPKQPTYSELPTLSECDSTLAPTPTTVHNFPETSSSSATASDSPPSSSHVREAQNFAAGIHRVLIWATCTAAGDATFAEASSRANLLDVYWHKFMAVTFAGDAGAFGDLVYTTEYEYLHAKTLIAALTDTTEAPPPQPAVPVILARTEKPTFCGDTLTWPTFRDHIASMTDASSLSGVQKMHYLRSRLAGEPLQLIDAYKVTNANYAKAWNALVARYGSRRLLVDAHIDRLFDAQPMDDRSSDSLRRLMYEFTETIADLAALEQRVEHWDVMLVRLFVSKLDADTTDAWEAILSADELPTFDQLRAFVEQRCLDADSQPLRHRFLCAVCNGGHQTVRCQRFEDMLPFERIRTVQALGLCSNCLRDDHTNRTCRRSRRCDKCNRLHHTMLHYDRLRLD